MEQEALGINENNAKGRAIKFSFIIPHKNTPDLLQKCLNSIPRREDVQIIVVDDNSDEDKVDFSHFPGLNDPTVEVYLTKEGKGAGYARNVGLKYAAGKWIVFADADDFFNPCLNEAMNKCEIYTCDLVLWKTNAINLETGKSSSRGAGYNEALQYSIANNDYIEALLISTPYKGFYSRVFLQSNRICFNECRWGNDVVFSTKVAIAARNVKAINEEVYCITEHASFGLISTHTYESQLVRFQQECQSAHLLRRSHLYFKDSIYYWCFESWFCIFKKYGKLKALKAFPYAIYYVGGPFIKQVWKSKFNK